MDKKKLSIIAIVLGVLFVAALVLFAVKDHQIKALADQDTGYQDLIQQYKDANRTDWPDYITYQESMIDGVSFDSIKGATQTAANQVSFVENEWNAVIGEAEAVKAVFTVDALAADYMAYYGTTIGSATIGDKEYTYMMNSSDILLQENIAEVPAVTVAEDAATVEVTATEDAATVEVTATEEAATTEPAADVAAVPAALTYCYAINEDGTITLTPDGEGEVITLTKTEAAAE